MTFRYLYIPFCLISVLVLNSALIVQAQQSEILPLCGIVAGPDEWNNLNPAVSISGQDHLAADVVKKGLHYNCAEQLRMVLQYIEEEDRSYWISSHLTTLPTGRAVPDTFHPENGESQLVHLSVDSPAETSLQPCYPGYSHNPNQYCTEELYGGKLSTGVLLYRQRHEDGTFESSPWIVSIKGAPGFVIRRKGECLTPRANCEYEILFPRNNDGSIQLQKDVQVLIQVSVRLDGAFVETDGYNSWMAIPLLITRSVPEASPSPTATPDPDASPTPQASPSPDTQVSANTAVVEWIAQAREIISAIKRRVNKKNRQEQLAYRTTLKEIAQALSDAILSNIESIVTYGPKFNLTKSSKKAYRKLSIFAKNKKARGFKTRKKRAIKAIKKLEKGISNS